MKPTQLTLYVKAGCSDDSLTWVTGYHNGQMVAQSVKSDEAEAKEVVYRVSADNLEKQGFEIDSVLITSNFFDVKRM